MAIVLISCINNRFAPAYGPPSAQRASSRAARSSAVAGATAPPEQPLAAPFSQRASRELLWRLRKLATPLRANSPADRARTNVLLVAPVVIIIVITITIVMIIAVDFIILISATSICRPRRVRVNATLARAHSTAPTWPISSSFVIASKVWPASQFDWSWRDNEEVRRTELALIAHCCARPEDCCDSISLASFALFRHPAASVPVSMCRAVACNVSSGRPLASGIFSLHSARWPPTGELG